VSTQEAPQAPQSVDRNLQIEFPHRAVDWDEVPSPGHRWGLKAPGPPPPSTLSLTEGPNHVIREQPPEGTIPPQVLDPTDYPPTMADAQPPSHHFLLLTHPGDSTMVL
jgi:hypothetical protein